VFTAATDASGPPLDGAIARVVSPCAFLGAVDEWRDITPTEVDASLEWRVTKVVLDPVTAGTVYLGTERRGLLRSTDCGDTWTKVSVGRNANALDDGLMWTLAIDPVDPNVLYAGATGSFDARLFRSVDGGIDWDSPWTESTEIWNVVERTYLGEFSIDPSDRRHSIATFATPCSGFIGGCMAESTDGGDQWRLLAVPARGGTPFLLEQGTWLWGTAQDGSYWTHDRGATWERVGPGNNASLYRARDGTYYLGSAYGTQRSTDGHTWTLIAGSPLLYGMVGDGERLIGGMRTSGPDQQPYFVARESEGTTWTSMASPPMADGPVNLAYDPEHHVVYSANGHGGLWRVVTR
jgi:hypothetical protein